MNTKLRNIVWILLLLSGCVKETLDECPTGDVRVKAYVEKFQTNTADPSKDVEDSFNKRIHDLHYYLYRDNRLIRDSILADAGMVTNPHYALEFGTLDFGDYRLVLIANGEATTVPGNDGLFIQYPGVKDAEDYFIGNFAFSVDCDCTSEYEMKLKRVHGVLQSVLHGLPAQISEVEVTLRGVNSQAGIDDKYSSITDVTKRYSLENIAHDQAIRLVMGTFPTPGDETAVYEIKFFTSSGTAPVYTQVIKDKVKIKRNQLTTVESDFRDGGFHFEVKVDRPWNDYIEGGDEVIH